jgi:hypothetical protein
MRAKLASWAVSMGIPVLYRTAVYCVVAIVGIAQISR